MGDDDGLPSRWPDFVRSAKHSMQPCGYGGRQYGGDSVMEGFLARYLMLHTIV